MNLELTENELNLLIDSVRFHLEDISNFPDENGEDVIVDLENLLAKLEENL